MALVAALKDSRDMRGCLGEWGARGQTVRMSAVGG